MEKDFAAWCALKARLHYHPATPTFAEREVWWCSIGLNIGHESDGKSSLYSRPVLVIRKFNRHLFWGVPLSTKLKDSPYYHPVIFKGQKQSLMLSQLRLWESQRFTRKMGQLPKEEFKEIKKKLRELLE